MTMLAAEPQSRLLTIDEFMALPDSSGYELVEGILVERKGMGVLSNYVAAQILILLGSFCRSRGAGHVFGADTVYRCFGTPDTGRKPDVSFVATSRFAAALMQDGSLALCHTGVFRLRRSQSPANKD